MTSGQTASGGAVSISLASFCWNSLLYSRGGGHVQKVCGSELAGAQAVNKLVASVRSSVSGAELCIFDLQKFFVLFDFFSASSGLFCAEEDGESGGDSCAGAGEAEGFGG